MSPFASGWSPWKRAGAGYGPASGAQFLSGAGDPGRLRAVQLAFELFCAAGATTACGLDLEKIDGVYVDYSHSPALEPCGANVKYVDEFVPFVEDILGVDIPSGVSFAWLDEETYDSSRMRACKGTTGCALRRKSYSRWPVHLHEVVHAALYPLNKDPLPFLREGIATALDMSNGVNLETIMSADPQAADPRTELVKERTPLNFNKIGLFTLYLLQAHGVEKYMELYQRSERGASRASVEALFVEVYGLTLDEVVETYLGGQSCPEDIVPVPWYECEAPTLDSADGLHWTFERRLECSDPDVRGGRDSDWGIHLSTTFLIEEPGVYAFEFVGDGSALAHVARCTGCRWLDRQLVISDGTVEEMPLSRGKYVLSVRLFGQEAGDVSVNIGPLR